ncbi:MAG: DUF1549 domain-containing protein, partial [Limisphaerales bacterium]
MSPRFLTLLSLSRRVARLLAAGTVALLATTPTPRASAGDTASPHVRAVDFVAEIQPIFAEHCLDCHGPEKQKSNYRLDVREIALKGGDSGRAAITPGDASTSSLVRFVAGLEPDSVMPPKGDRLSDSQVALLRSWIDQGAVWPDSASTRLDDGRDWWSLQPLHRPGVPESTGASHPIDAFIRDRLAREGGGKPAPAADRRTLIRRVTFDLTGLPPTPEEVAAFAADPDPRSYERLVDRLLASPRYGERWARHWLDVVHYGDTQGYDKDKPRPNAWPY